MVYILLIYMIFFRSFFSLVFSLIFIIFLFQYESKTKTRTEGVFFQSTMRNPIIQLIIWRQINWICVSKTYFINIFIQSHKIALNLIKIKFLNFFFFFSLINFFVYFHFGLLGFWIRKHQSKQSIESDFYVTKHRTQWPPIKIIENSIILYLLMGQQNFVYLAKNVLVYFTLTHREKRIKQKWQPI